MSDFDNVVPDWDDVPENDEAEPDDLMVAHEATPEEVEAATQDSDESQDSDEVDISQYENESETGWYEIPGHDKALHGEDAAREALTETQEDEA